MPQTQAFFTALNGRVKFVRGMYNITADPVFLAAFVGVQNTKTILDVGIGTGGAALCVLEHNPTARMTGIDISAEMLSECEQNAGLNGRKIELLENDILLWHENRTFDIVMTNPPYFKGTARINNAHHNVNLCDWVHACVRHLRPRGWFYCITDAARTSEIIAAMVTAKLGNIRIVPLCGMDKDIAERTLFCGQLNSHAGTIIRAPISMNDNNILRDGKTISNL